MNGSMRIAYIPPLCHFKIGYEVFPFKPPWFCAKIYPFIGFDPPLESKPKISYHNNNIVCAPSLFS